MKDFFAKIAAFYKALDKQVHIFIVNSIAMFVFIIFVPYDLKWLAWLGYAVVNVIAIVCSIVRELLAFKRPEKYSFEWADLVADAHGLALANVQMLFYMKIHFYLLN